MLRHSNTVEVVQEVHFHFRNGRAVRRYDVEPTEHPISLRCLNRQRTPQYPLDDVDVGPSAVQRTLEIDLSALEKGHKNAAAAHRMPAAVEVQTSSVCDRPLRLYRAGERRPSGLGLNDE